MSSLCEEKSDSEPIKVDLDATPRRKIAKTNTKHRQQKFRDAWLQHEDFIQWLSNVPEDPYKAKCRTCNAIINAELTVIKNHMASKGHTNRRKSLEAQPTISKMPRQRVVSLRQLDQLIQLMDDNRAVANSRIIGGVVAHQEVKRVWDTITDTLNSIGDGCNKTAAQWKAYWQEQRYRARKKVADRHHRTGASSFSALTDTEVRILEIMGVVSYDDDPVVKIPLSANSQASKPKRFKPNHFSQVKKACVELVKVHGRPISLFDDAAFKDLINCIPLTNKEKETITSAYIQTLIDNDEEVADDSTDMDATADQTCDEEQDVEAQAVKEIMKSEVIICNCAKDSDQPVEKHDPTCPVACDVPQQSFWNFFEVTLDEAKCNICNKIMNWSTIMNLKEHLQSYHPDLEFLDDDEDFEKGPPSTVGSREDVEEIYLHDNSFEDPIKTSIKTRYKAKQPLLGIKPFTTETIADSLHRFKSLDYFGTYVASLLKLIPKDKCVKFQIEIVERLLREQVAAA